jgi:hypothetical protein
MFERLGQALGYTTRRTWTRELPTDGVWLLPESGLYFAEMPAVAIEVAVSEGPKAVKGSIDTLAELSPALGVLLINELEIRRGELRKGVPAEDIERRLEHRTAAARDRSARHQQRIEIWSYADLRRRYQLATGAQEPETLTRLATGVVRQEN